MTHGHGLKTLLSLIVATQLVLMPVSFALKIEIQKDMKLRENTDGSMERVGLLKRGSIVEIPDQYVVKKNGKPDLELTLNNWLKTAGEHRAAGFKSDGAGQYSYDGEHSEFFFPIRVTGPAPGSTIRDGHQNNQQFIALKFLARKGAALVVSDDAVVESRPTPAALPASPARNSGADTLEAKNPCSTGVCSQPSDVSTPVRNLISALSPALSAAESRSRQIFKRTTNDLDHVNSNFENSCGFDLSEFTPILKEQARSRGVPAEVLMGLLTQESSGRCYVLNSETDKTQSVGLFQINSLSTKIPRCTNAEKNVLRNLGSASRLATGPRCLENPLVNLQESIRILTSMKTTLVSGRNGFDEAQLSDTDLWRLVASSYNGGARWALQAKKDLEEFNRSNGTNLSAYKWEDLRLFYLRRWLNRDSQQSLFGSNNHGRSKENSIANLSYAENIVGRSSTATYRPGLSHLWRPSVGE